MSDNSSVCDAELMDIRDADLTWGEAPLEDLVVHILTTFHEPLRRELPRLQSLSQDVLASHGSAVDAELDATLTGLKVELEDHMAKEEQILFPMILRGQGWMADGPISVMHHEHDSATAAVARMSELTCGYEAEPEACGAKKDLWKGLAVLERGLHLHIHLENNILFPRALADMPDAGHV